MKHFIFPVTFFTLFGIGFGFLLQSGALEFIGVGNEGSSIVTSTPGEESMLGMFEIPSIWASVGLFIGIYSGCRSYFTAEDDEEEK